MNREHRSIVLEAQPSLSQPQRDPIPLTARISRDPYTDRIEVFISIGETQARLVGRNAQPRNRKEAEQLVRDFLSGLGVRADIRWDVQLAGAA